MQIHSTQFRRLLLIASVAALPSALQAADEPTEPATKQTSDRPADKSPLKNAPAQVGEPFAQAELEAAPGSQVAGTVKFYQDQKGLYVRVDIKNAPVGGHGFHIHENGECTPPDFASAGGHFDPTGTKHGSPTDAETHMGDLGNLVAGNDGRISHEAYFRPKYRGETVPWESIIGKAVILHENPDDYITQPTGNSGGRIACGVIVGTKK